MIAMGAFMGAAVNTIRANQQARQKRNTRAAATVVARDQLTAKEREILSGIGKSNQTVLEPSRIAAEATLGRVETREEVIERECEVLGYSPTSMKRSW